MKRPNIDRCRGLRKGQTDAEKRLWSKLRDRRLDGIKFRRQFSVGNYILDFYSTEHKICIEADGGQHFEPTGEEKDKIRTDELSKLGIMVLRYNNLDILKNIEGVCEDIISKIKNSK